MLAMELLVQQHMFVMELPVLVQQHMIVNKFVSQVTEIVYALLKKLSYLLSRIT
jgi:hypothetical protein